ncbi:MAG: GAF domain-containing protein, partial [Anaerolineae bacterium]|nr:GAF domain-containing protein [Anaerolineae bacterium]
MPDSDTAEFPRFFEGEGIVGHVLATGDGYVAIDCESDPIYKRFTKAEQLGSLMAQPLKYGDSVMGVLSVHSAGRRVEFTDHDQEFVRALADV